MSATGIRLRTVAMLEAKTEFDGALVLEDGSRIPLRAVVVWMTPPDHRGFVPSELGLELKNVPEAYLAALARLFAEVD
ncbi:MAG: PilZ domain-containing protein [Myxococcales bacterium]|nr:PilZ domain-containing protein [Myxococcales bacterium]